MSRRILLHVNNLCETGTTTAVLEYADGLLLRNYTVTIAYDANATENNLEMIRKARSTCETIGYSNFQEISRLAKSKFDVGYFLKAGAIDGKILRSIPSVVHAVFQHYEPHGNRYAYISEWLRDEMDKKRKSLNSKEKLKVLLKGGKIPTNSDLQYVPHCVTLPTQDRNLRREWGIPMDATVGIRIGGLEKFDIDWVQRTVIRALDMDKNLFFVFINTNRFASHPRLKHYDLISSNQEKVNALCSSDFFIHGRRMGESFGLAILEAMRCKIPVLAWMGGNDLNHTKILSKNSLYFDEHDLLHKIMNIQDNKESGINYQKSLEFSREAVMNRFEEIFLNPF